MFSGKQVYAQLLYINLVLNIGLFWHSAKVGFLCTSKKIIQIRKANIFIFFFTNFKNLIALSLNWKFIKIEKPQYFKFSFWMNCLKCKICDKMCIKCLISIENQLCNGLPWTNPKMSLVFFSDDPKNKSPQTRLSPVNSEF